jgi:hypothetical protein
MDSVRVQGCKGATVQRQQGVRTLGRTLADMADAGEVAVIRNTRGRRSDLIVSPRGNGGLTIRQGPSHVLIGPGEIGPFIAALQTLTSRTAPTNN